MEEWVEDFGTCEDLLGEVLDKVMVQKLVEKSKDLCILKTLEGGEKSEERGRRTRNQEYWGAGNCEK